MKYVRLFLVILFLFSLLQGCSQPADDPPTFYYLHAEPQYGISGSIIGSESRRNADTDMQLRYLLALYLSGPIDSSLRTPFPKGSAILVHHMDEQWLHLTMNGAFYKLEGVDIIKACACISLTVFENSDIQGISIHFTEAGSGIPRKVEFSRDSLMLHDAVLPDP